MNYNPFSIEGKTILITGASSGIGRSSAIQCSKLGAKVIINGRNEERLTETIHMMENINHSFVIADLAQEKDIDFLVSSLPVIDGAIFCAGFLKKNPLKFITEKSLLETFYPNFFANALLCQRLIRNKKLKNEASVIFISSIAASIASFGNLTYMASKGALNSFAKGMALEVAEKRIRVNVIEPALIKTNLSSVLTEEALDNYEKKFPLGRFGFPEEIAFAAIFLLSDASKWITGSTLRMDGGVTLRS